MMFPRFDDFLATLTPDVMKEITEEISKSGLKNEGETLTEIINQTLTNSEIVSYLMTIEILRRYHEFISERLK